jgi:hypothetical protein
MTGLRLPNGDPPGRGHRRPPDRIVGRFDPLCPKGDHVMNAEPLPPPEPVHGPVPAPAAAKRPAVTRAGMIWAGSGH